MIVAEANKAWGDVPYTLQPGGCGEEGDYIHLTPSYLIKKAKDRTTVKGRSLDFTYRTCKFSATVFYAFSLGPPQFNALQCSVLTLTQLNFCGIIPYSTNLFLKTCCIQKSNREQ